jgi:hypothetical protein
MTGAGTGILSADSNLTIVVANLAEVYKSLTYADLAKGTCCACDCLDDLGIVLSIGARYSSITQNYTGSLTNGQGNSSTRYSTQSFHGIGLTSAVDLFQPLSEHWGLFSSTRGSLLYGENRKDSTISVIAAGQPGQSSNINETQSELIPVVELSAGVQWDTLFGTTGDPSKRQTALTVRLAAVGQYWGSVGPLSAGSSQAYRNSDLFLVGASFTVGIHR